MRLISNTLKVHWAVWSDPGDSPCGAGGMKLPSSSYIEEISGEAKIQLDLEEWQGLARDDDLDKLVMPFILKEVVVPSAIDYPTWNLELRGNVVSARITDFVTDKNS